MGDEEKSSAATNQETFESLLDQTPYPSRPSSIPGLTGGPPPLLNRPFNPPSIITSMIEASAPPLTPSPTPSPQGPLLRELLDEIRNTEAQEPTPQPQRNSSSGWFGVVTKAVNKADNAVLNIVDRLPSISNSSRREASGSDITIQECKSCQMVREFPNVNELPSNSFAEAVRHCVRKQCKCKCHLSPSSSLVQARRNHGAVQRSSNKKPPLERRHSGQQRESGVPILGDERPPVRETLMMRLLAAENASSNIHNLDNQNSINRSSSNQNEDSSPPIPSRSSSKKKNKKKK